MIICGNKQLPFHQKTQICSSAAHSDQGFTADVWNAWDFKFRYRIDGPSPGRTRTILKKEAGVGVGQLIVSHEDFKWQKA